MKTTVLALAAATALTAGAASAQGYYGHDWNRGGMSIDQRQQMLDRRIERGVQTGELTRREAWQARRAYQDIQRVEYRYRADGILTRWERNDLDRRLDALATQVRMDRHDDQQRYGYNDYRR